MLDANLRESDSIQCILNEIRFPWQVFFKTTYHLFLCNNEELSWQGHWGKIF